MNFLPFSTIYDPAEDPPSSIDPLGTLSEAERLADILLPGFTGRMWRPRLLTFSAVAAEIANRVVRLTGREDVRQEARLVCERLFVAAIAWKSVDQPDEYKNTSIRLPGRTLAERAWREGEPLRSGNFLKGQAVNGPFGVMARLARALGIIDSYGKLGSSGHELLLAWSSGQGLSNFLEETDQIDGEGIKWAKLVTKTVSQGLGKQGDWPGRNQQIWDVLASALRPDQLKGAERKAIVRTLYADPVRDRMLQLMRTEKSLNVYRANLSDERGVLERRVLLDAVKRLLDTKQPADRTIGSCLDAIDAYEQGSALLQQIFDALLWGLRSRSGRAKQTDIVRMSAVSRTIRQAMSNARQVGSSLERLGKQIKDLPLTDAAVRGRALDLLRDDVALCQGSLDDAVSAVMTRHEKVQRAKNKATWMECGQVWTLMPGFGTDAPQPPEYTDIFLHPMRLLNGYSFLRDLGLVQVPVMDGGNDN